MISLQTAEYLTLCSILVVGLPAFFCLTVRGAVRIYVKKAGN